MSEMQIVFELTLHIRKPPQHVRSWWTDFPEDYIAKDPTEQPFRIITKKKTSSGKELQTFWRLPDGSVREQFEIMQVKQDGSWTFEIPNHSLGFHILDEFSVESKNEEKETILHIHSTITPNPSIPYSEAKPRLETLSKSMGTVWRRAAEICEQDTQ
jgi:hypothetical protein